MRIQIHPLFLFTALVLAGGSTAHAGRSLSGRAYDAPIFANHGEEFSVTSIRKEDDHILGSLSFTDVSGHPNRSSDPCRFKKRVERVDIYADGRINQVTQTQSAECPKSSQGAKRRPVRQKTSVSSPKLTVVSPEKLGTLMAALKAKQAEAETRAVAAHAVQAESEEETRTPLVISLSRESGGSESRAELHRVVTGKTDFNREAWKSVQRLLQMAISNGS